MFQQNVVRLGWFMWSSHFFFFLNHESNKLNITPYIILQSVTHPLFLCYFFPKNFRMSSQQHAHRDSIVGDGDIA